MKKQQDEAQEIPEYLVDEETQHQMLIKSGAYKKFNNILLAAECLHGDDDYFNALADWYAQDPSMIERDQGRLRKVWTILRKFDDFLLMLKELYANTDNDNNIDKDIYTAPIEPTKSKRSIKSFLQYLKSFHTHTMRNYRKTHRNNK